MGRQGARRESQLQKPQESERGAMPGRVAFRPVVFPVMAWLAICLASLDEKQSEVQRAGDAAAIPGTQGVQAGALKP
jgi:hypothetical protein